MMQIAMVGLGRMGANMVRRLQADGHECVAFDVNPASVQALAAEGATGVGSLAEVVSTLATPRHVWIMVPAAFVGSTVDQLAAVLDPVTRSSTAATPGTATTSTGPGRSPPRGSTTSTSARPGEPTGSSAATA